MSTSINHTSPIVGGIIAIFALSIAGIIFRIMFLRRMRAAAYANQNSFRAAPLRQTFPTQPPPPRFNPPPPNNFNPPPNWNRNNTHNNWNQPPPPYPQPWSPPTPTSPPTSPRQAPRRFNPSTPPAPVSPTRPSVPSFPSPPSGPSPPSAPSPPSPPSPPSNPSPPSPPSQPSAPSDGRAQPSHPDPAPMNLVDRMREVQQLMIQIHNLESQPTSQSNREKIQELQRRVTELSDVETYHEVPSGPAPAPPPTGPAPVNPEPASPPVHEDGRSVAHDPASRQDPPAYALDGRDD